MNAEMDVRLKIAERKVQAFEAIRMQARAGKPFQAACGYKSLEECVVDILAQAEKDINKWLKEEESK